MSGRATPLAALPARASLAALVAALVLLVVYAATIAPGVTFWDAGEFIAAARALGIPHPPGTPLYVLLLTTWARLLPLPTALATNLFSAVCTAAACGIGALLMARWTGRPLVALAAAVCAGGMSTVWLNATETEVYAATLALAVLTLAAADRAGRTGDRRWLLLAAYLTVLAVPLHMSALVAGPAVVYAAAAAAHGPIRPPSAAVVAGAWLMAMGVGTVSSVPVIAGLATILGGAVVPATSAPLAVARRLKRLRAAVATTAGVVAVGAVAASALLFLIVRAQHDPVLNQGSPTTLAALADVVARRQYDVAPLWPRRAPLWLQTANIFQYADWQVALSLGATVIPTPQRVLATLVFAVLGVVGCVAHRGCDRRSWRVVLLLLISGSLGVVIYLNLRAGPSFGWGILPDDATREARERDYFFVLGFWAWGLWAGYGAVVAAERVLLRRTGPGVRAAVSAPNAVRVWPAAALGVAVAALPLALNWRAVDRGRWPEAVLPRFLAVSLLEAAPPGSVLFVGGDNDTYPLWHAQAVLGKRRDVTVVTTPLLPADWYRAELWRRHRLHPDPALRGWQGRTAASRDVAANARRLGRPVAVAVTMPGEERRSIGGAWELRGPVFVEVGERPSELRVDSTATARWAGRFEAWRAARWAPASIDPTSQLVLDVLSCPGWTIGVKPANGAGRPGSRSLASLCNLR